MENGQGIGQKVKEFAQSTGRAAAYAAEVAGKKATELAEDTRVRLRLFNSKAERDTLLRELGSMVFAAYQSGLQDEQKLDDKLAEIAQKQAEVDALTEQLAQHQPGEPCPHCGHRCGEKDVFCAGCGAPRAQG